MSKDTKYSLRNLKEDFPNEEVCLSFVFDTLHSRECSCGGKYSPIKGRKQFQCSKCRFQIAPTATTIFHKSDTPLSLWFYAIFIFSNAKSGISAKELERQLGVTYKCAWRILSLIRKALEQDDNILDGTVEIDSSYMGGKKMPKERPHAWADKSVIISAVERGGRMKAKVVDNMGGKTMERFIKENIKEGATLMTDSARSYIKPAKNYKHSIVNHSKEYVRGKVHINTIESFFSHVKRSVRGTFKVVSKQHLQSYLDAFVFHWNNRGNDRERFGVLLDALLHA